MKYLLMLLYIIGTGLVVAGFWIAIVNPDVDASMPYLFCGIAAVFLALVSEKIYHSRGDRE